MKKNYAKHLQIVRNRWLRPLVLTGFCILFLFCSISPANAGSLPTASPDELQQQTITGTVTDAATGEALIGVTVLVKGTTTGALTDVNGRFTVNVSERQVTLVISFIGYTTQEVLANVGTPANVALAIEVAQIQEVVVVGYGTQKKESVVGAITQVNNASLMKAGTVSVTNAIAGKLSGVLTIQQTGEPGSNSAGILCARSIKLERFSTTCTC